MTEQLVDPQLQAFFDSNPEILRPDAAVDPKVPAWYDNAVVELAGSILAVRGLAAMWMRMRPPPPVDQVQVFAGQAWRHHAPTWLQFSVPAIQQVYTAGRVQGLSPDEMEAMATAHAQTLGDYLEQTSAEALADGYVMQLNQKWDSSLAWHRASEAYGLDRPDMRTYIRAVMAQPPGGRDPIGTGARMLMDRLMIARADNVAKNETWTAGQTGLAMSWRIRAERGDLMPGTRRAWMTRKRESPCAICGPMDGQVVDLDEDFVLPDGSTIMAPAVHPGCQCSQRLVEPVSKARTAAAGIVLVAADTGRVLMLQRQQGDHRGGLWEFPGGKVDQGETALAAAKREYREEVRSALPSDARLISDWKWGMYEGFVHITPREADVEPHKRGRAFNPDDPNRKHIEAIAWWDPQHVARNPAVRPEVRRSWTVALDALRVARPRQKVSKAKRLDDGRLDEYDRTPKGQFAAREMRTRDVTRYADPIVLPKAVQDVVDEALSGVEAVNPFGKPDDSPPNPFAARSAFLSQVNPFAARANPFAATPSGPNPFAAAPSGPNPFDRTLKAKAAVPESLKRKRVIHHIFMPKKSTEDAAHYETSDAHYLPFSEWQGTFEFDGNRLIQPGEHFDFNEPAAVNADAAREGETMSPDLADIYDTYTEDNHGYSRLNAATAPRELLQMFSLTGVKTANPFDQAAADLSETLGPDEQADRRDRWSKIWWVALNLWNEVMDSPDKIVQSLNRQELDHIYDLAGYERDESDEIARDRIVDHCQAHGVGDDSLAEAFADYAVWSKHGLLGSDGKRLGQMLDDAREDDLPDLTNEYGNDPVHQVFVFDHGFHPGTLERSETLADVDGDYTVHHVIYRSNLGENGGQVPFMTGIREASMWPADSDGRFLHGGPYRDYP